MLPLFLYRLSYSLGLALIRWAMGVDESSPSSAAHHLQSSLLFSRHTKKLVCFVRYVAYVISRQYVRQSSAGMHSSNANGRCVRTRASRKPCRKATTSTRPL